MEINALPQHDTSINAIGCCTRFNPEGRDGQELYFRDEEVVRAVTMSAMQAPLNMGKVVARVERHIQETNAFDADDMIVLGRVLSPSTSEHLFSVTRTVADEEMSSLIGDIVTKVFEGPCCEAGIWDQ